MASLPTTPTWPQRLLHAWALLTVVATVVLLALGAIVTTFKVGMADPVWPTYPWHLLLIDWSEPSAGFLIEHTHRLVGYLVGVLFIVLAVGTCVVATERRLRWLGPLALLCVIVQGLLGGFRVKLNALVGTDLAVVHGTFAQVVFSIAVAIAVLTAPRRQAESLPASTLRPAFRLSLLLTAAAFAQLVWGALLRHTLSPLAQRGHLLTAFLVVSSATWLAVTVFQNTAGLTRHLRWPMLLMGLFLTLQIMLGVEAFLHRFASATLPEMVGLSFGQAAIRTLHVLLGSWILADAVYCVVLTFPGRVTESSPSFFRALLAWPRPVTALPTRAFQVAEHLEGRA